MGSCLVSPTASAFRPSHPPCASATLEVDALHLCYLALVLWLFRNRIALRYLRNRWVCEIDHYLVFEVIA